MITKMLISLSKVREIRESKGFRDLIGTFGTECETLLQLCHEIEVERDRAWDIAGECCFGTEYSGEEYADRIKQATRLTRKLIIARGEYGKAIKKLLAGKYFVFDSGSEHKLFGIGIKEIDMSDEGIF